MAFDIATKELVPEPLYFDPLPVVSVHYGEPTQTMNHNHFQCSVWFNRGPSNEEISTLEVKGNEETGGPAPKRRKIRTGKQKDVGSMLGGFVV